MTLIYQSRFEYVTRFAINVIQHGDPIILPSKCISYRYILGCLWIVIPSQILLNVATEEQTVSVLK